jgi:hypothetical protein
MRRIVPHTLPRVGRSHKHFADEFEICLLQSGGGAAEEREFFIHNLLVRIRLIMEMMPAWRHESLNFLFQVPLYLPSFQVGVPRNLSVKLFKRWDHPKKGTVTFAWIQTPPVFRIDSNSTSLFFFITLGQELSDTEVQGP